MKKRALTIGMMMLLSMATCIGCGKESKEVTVISATESSTIDAPETETADEDTEMSTESSESETDDAKADDTTTDDATTDDAATDESTNTIKADLSGEPGFVTRDTTVWDPTTLSNTSIPYGNNWDDTNELGVPNGIAYYQNLYSKYNAVYHIETTEKLLYLTMDEGYEAGYTPEILDTLKEKGVKATFFITKQFYDSDPDLIQRMIAEGHVIGNHTCLHPKGGFPKYIDEHGLDSFIDDVSTMHNLIKDTFGYEMTLFRFPEGESSEMTMAQLSNMGYTSVFWSYAHRDFVLDDQPEVSVTLDRCISHIHPGAIYLLHAVSSSNTAALADFIDAAYAQGYTFAPLPIN